MATVSTVLTNDRVERHSVAETLALHLAPGVAVLLAFVLLGSLVAQAGLPASLALLLAWPMAGLPLELGFLLAVGRRRNGRLSLEGVVPYRQPMPRRQTFALIVGLLLWTAVVSTVLTPLGDALRQALFLWWPRWLLTGDLVQRLSEYPRAALWAVVALSAVLNVAIPVVEELYFRGYLMPRIPTERRWAPAVSAILFSLYHFWLPWEAFSRVVALLPVAYAVQWKRNVSISILVHVLLNSLGTLGLLALVLSRA